MTEEWRPIPGFEGRYEVSSLGRVRNAKGQIVKHHRHFRGYRQIHLYRAKPERPLTRKVHRLVGLAFIPNPDNKPEINHINNDPADNRVENLEWVTASENRWHAARTGPGFACATNPNRIRALTVEDVADIRRRYDAGERLCDINRSYPTVNSAFLGRVAKRTSRVLG